MGTMVAGRTMKARFAGRCFCCEAAFPVGAEIVFNGKATLATCVAAELEAQAREEAEQFARHTKQAAEFKAGLMIRTEVVRGRVHVTRCPSYKMARAAAVALVAEMPTVGGPAKLVCHTRGGKRYCGEELTSGGYNGTMTYHEGWAFRFRVAAQTTEAA